MKRQRTNLHQNPTRRLALLSKFIIFPGIVFVIGVFIAVYIRRVLKTSDFFRIRDVIIKENSNIDLSYLKGRNIFTIDLKKESESILKLHPNYKKIRLIRILPDRLFVDFTKRKPLAYVRLYRVFCIDEDAVLFDVPEQLGDPDLPFIFGLETKIYRPKNGDRYNIKELLLALNIIKNNPLKDYKIKRIDVDNASDARFFIVGNTEGQGPLEIKIGQDNVNNKLNLLDILIIQIKEDWNNIKYVDLRFKEPVVKFRNSE